MNVVLSKIIPETVPQSLLAERLRHGRHGPRRPRERGGYGLILFISGLNHSHQNIEKGHVIKVANIKAKIGLLPLLYASLETQKILNKKIKEITIIIMGGHRFQWGRQI